MIEFNIQSNQHLSALLFGGTLITEAREPCIDENGDVILTKTGPNKGQMKTKIVKKEVQVKGFGLNPLAEWKTKQGWYQTNEEVLTKLLKALEGRVIYDHRHKFLTLLLERRKLAKELSTYYDGHLDKLYPDSCLRPNYNHTASATMRLSCNAPNLQNIVRSK
jgi:hypothetical protein